MLEGMKVWKIEFILSLFIMSAAREDNEGYQTDMRVGTNCNILVSLGTKLLKKSLDTNVTSGIIHIIIV